MNCPICNLDLSPLDLVSRTEHVDLCIEHGPSEVGLGESGQLIIKKSIPVKKQRKICPVCDKTFQNVHLHFKVCAIKNDVPPNLMIEHWDRMNVISNDTKKFPPKMLEEFVSKCIKEGRVGEQVDLARALFNSITGDELQTRENTNPTPVIAEPQEETTDVLAEHRRDINQVLRACSSIPHTKNKVRPKFRLEMVDEMTKRANIELRISRELAGRHTYPDSSSQLFDTVEINQEDNEITKLFHRARMKTCNGSTRCLEASCDNHELLLLMDDFRIYSGASLESASRGIETERRMSESSGTRVESSGVEEIDAVEEILS